MIFNNSENKCLFMVLQILNKKDTTYSDLFRETKFSHTTLQKVLKNLLDGDFVSKDGNYSITSKGKGFLEKLEEVKRIV